MIVLVVLTISPRGELSANDPFAFLLPDVVITAADRARIEGGGTFVRVLPGGDRQLSVSAATRINVDGTRFVAWATEVERLQKGRYVSAIGRFSDPPQLDDVDTLVFDDDDLDDVRRCRPSDCGLKLHATEIADLQAQLGGKDWKIDLQDRLRAMVVRRAVAYRARGDAGILAFHDRGAPVDPRLVFCGLLERLTFLARRFPCTNDSLGTSPPGADVQVIRDFLYWSKETLGVRPIVSLTHLMIARFEGPGLPEVVAIAKQVYATHYRNASLSVTAITGREPERYLVYVHRSQVDVLHGAFGGLMRRMIERRVKAEAPGVLSSVRRRIESGDPPRR